LVGKNPDAVQDGPHRSVVYQPDQFFLISEYRHIYRPAWRIMLRAAVKWIDAGVHSCWADRGWCDDAGGLCRRQPLAAA
jgi:hypothetical protein